METINISHAKLASGAIEVFNLNIILKKVNIFVGPNNSGKSRLIRALIDPLKCSYEYKYDVLVENIYSIAEAFKSIPLLNDIVSDDATKVSVKVLTELIDILKNNPGIIINQNFIDDINKIGNTFNNITRNCKRNNLSIYAEIKKVNVKIDKSKNEILGFCETRKDKEIKRTIYYVPTLRGLRTIDFFDVAKDKIEESFIKAQLNRALSFNKDFYKGRTLKDYWSNDNKEIVSFKDNSYNYSEFEKSIKVNIFTGLSLYDELMAMMLGDYSERESIQEWCQFLGDNYFEQKINITPNLKEQVVKIKLGDEPERSIHDLGDGLQSIIIITFLMFKCKNQNTLIAIEEPELYLHPGMQRILIENMLNVEFNKIQYLITTHSNHFLDVFYENKDVVNIYNCYRKNSKIELDNILNTKKGEILTNIGVKPSSIFLSNAIIMVEGISDIIYFRKFLDLYMSNGGQKRFIEDKHYTFVESSGNNIVHWDFIGGEIKAETVFKNIFVIADSDGINIDEISKKDDETLTLKEKRIKKIKELEHSYVLYCREIENLLPWSAIKNYIVEKESFYGGIKREINKDLIDDIANMENVPLGDAIQTSLEKLKSNLENKKVYIYKTDNGTIVNKLEFSKGIIMHLDNFEQLTVEAQKVTKEIYRFISEVNK